MRTISVAVMLLLAGCAATPPNAAQVAAAYRARTQDVPESPNHPKGYVVAFPPADVSAVPLRCRPNGEDTVCERVN